MSNVKSTQSRTWTHRSRIQEDPSHVRQVEAPSPTLDTFESRALPSSYVDLIPPAAPSDDETVSATKTQPQPNPTRLERKFNHLKDLIEENGGKFSSKGPNMVAFRRNTNTNANQGGGRYDDQIAVIWQDSKGKPHVIEVTANTEPSARYRGQIGEDTNSDGRLDQGRLALGYYEYEFSTFRDKIALRMRQDGPVERDTNRDGKFNELDSPQISPGGAASMLIHAGGPKETLSAGCQTAPPEEYERLIQALKKAGLTNNVLVGYTLVGWEKRFKV